jgi:hypothetical protein
VARGRSVGPEAGTNRVLKRSSHLMSPTLIRTGAHSDSSPLRERTARRGARDAGDGKRGGERRDGDGDRRQRLHRLVPRPWPPRPRLQRPRRRPQPRSVLYSVAPRHCASHRLLSRMPCRFACRESVRRNAIQRLVLRLSSCLSVTYVVRW